MSKKRRSYPEAFKREIVALYEAGEQSAASLEREYDIGRGNIWRWARKYGSVAAAEDAVATSEARRIRELERELEITRQERDILKKAIAIFSQPQPPALPSSRPTGENTP